MYEPWARFNQGILVSRGGNPRGGIEIMEAAMATAKEFDAELLRPLHLAHLAATHATLGESRIGLCLLDEALKTATDTEERMFEAELFRLRGELLIGSGEIRQAETAFAHALAVARGQKARMWELRAAVSLARLFCDQGRRDEARDLLAPVYGWFTEGFAAPDLKEAKALLDELT
jgi:predicted ATPase